MSLEEVSIEDNSDALSAARLQIRTEGDWLYCQRRLDELEAQVEILRVRLLSRANLRKIKRNVLFTSDEQPAHRKTQTQIIPILLKKTRY